MNKEELIKQIKKSRRQNINERYEYISSHFNQTNYAISLEKYVKELLKENNQLKERIEYLERSNNRREETILDLRSENVDLATKIDKAIEYIEKHSFFVDDTGYGKIIGYPN